MSDNTELRVSGPPCRHPEPRAGCPFCEPFYDKGTVGLQYRAALLQRIIPSTVIPANPNRINAGPCRSTIRLPCVHEGPPLLACTQTDERYRVRRCDHPSGEIDCCARQTTPTNPSWGKGQNCQECRPEFYEAKSRLIVP